VKSRIIVSVAFQQDNAQAALDPFQSKHFSLEIARLQPLADKSFNLQYYKDVNFLILIRSF